MRIIPVIHLVNLKQCLKSLELCEKYSINKVFLINHDINFESGYLNLLGMYCDCKNRYPNINIGVNILQVDCLYASKLIHQFRDVYSLWADNCFIDAEDISLIQQVKSNLKSIPIFGGLAFKYQPQPSDLQKSCETAIKYVDVITTSGNRTGQPPSIDKISKIRDFIGNHPLAIASGVSADNISNFKNVDYFLVASSITNPKTEIIIEEELKKLIDLSYN